MEKTILILLIVTSCIGIDAKKINLDDIERDNLRAESGSSSLTKTDTGNHNYQYTQQYPDRYDGGLGSYSTIASNHDDYRVNADSYSQAVSENDIPYEKDTRENSAYVINQLKSEYPGYSQQLYQEPQITVGNHYQKMQQKAATPKYQTTASRGVIYIPMSQLLAYYPDLSLGQKNTMNLHDFKRLPVPVYKPLNQVTFTNVPSKTSHDKYSHNQSKKSQQTDVIFPSKTDHLQELIYASATSPHEPVASRLTTYTSVPVYVQGQAIPSHAYKQMREYNDEAKRLQYTVPLNKPVYWIQDEQNVEHYQKASPSSIQATSPSYTEENLKLPNHVYSSGESDENYKQNHFTSLPKSLLDTYVPSHIIAAQDANRYRERPLQLEGGFLPSRINFVNLYKKRESE